MAYKDLLKDPRWNKKRVEILKRDNYLCTECGRGKIELHVHHIYYEVNRLPWQYPNNAFLTLCNTCHNDYHKNEPALISSIIRNFKKSGLPLDQIFDLSLAYASLNIEPLGEADDIEIYITAALRHILYNKDAAKIAIELFKNLSDEQRQFYYLVNRIS